ncbi:MAG TPA: DUF4399 domain-containing protein [Chitinophagaceae bacterium]|nr:DUF4399 domain-containing protein [Chitinophagaceae bacterium]
MRNLCLIATLLLFGLMSCNQSGKNSAATTDADSTMNHHDMSAVSNQQPLPEVPDGAKVFFRNLKDGQTVTDPFTVEMGITGMSVDSSGKVRPGSGHHHLIIDGGDSIPAGTVVPQDATHLHFGNAQTETKLDLTPGKHTLTLQFADGLHRSYGSKLAASITVTVKK